MLVPLSALQQLTWLRLERVRKEQLSLLQLPLLQQLHVELCQPSVEPAAPSLAQLPALQETVVTRSTGGMRDAQLQLGDLTALQVLRHIGRGNCCLQETDELPAGLQELMWVGGQASCSMQPLLGLSHLVKLFLAFVVAPAAWQLQQLGSICSLQEVRLQYRRQTRCEAAAAAAWLALPMKALVLERTAQWVIEAGVLEVIGELTGLTRLSFACCDSAARIESGVQAQGTLEQLAGAVLKLTALQSLGLSGLRMRGCDGLQVSSAESVHTLAVVQALVAAIGSLPWLTELSVQLPVKLSHDAAEQQLDSLQQLLPQLKLARHNLSAGRLLLATDFYYEMRYHLSHWGHPG
jgi:hypothetical protein